MDTLDGADSNSADILIIFIDPYYGSDPVLENKEKTGQKRSSVG